MFYNFLWNDKGDKIKSKVMISYFSEGWEGGLKMIDVASFNRSLIVTWIKKVPKYGGGAQALPSPSSACAVSFQVETKVALCIKALRSIEMWFGQDGRPPRRFLVGNITFKGRNNLTVFFFNWTVIMFLQLLLCPWWKIQPFLTSFQPKIVIYATYRGHWSDNFLKNGRDSVSFVRCLSQYVLRPNDCSKQPAIIL